MKQLMMDTKIVVNSLVKSTTILYINESHPNVPAAAAASVGNETKTFMASPVSASPSLIASGNKLLACINNWKQPYPLLLHIALAITFLGFLSPSNRRGLLIQYSCFVIGYMLQAVWAISLFCGRDVFSWDVSFVVINLLQLFLVLHSLRPVRFSPQLEDIYKTLFQPLNTPRLLFRKLTSSEICSVCVLKSGEAYAKQDITKTDRLSLLIAGSVTVSCNGKTLHQIREKQFIDSPEFEATIRGEEIFKVSIVANGECRYLCWQRQPLEFLFSKEPYLASIMDAVLGRDVTNKLYTMGAVNNNAKKAAAANDLRLPCSKEHQHSTTTSGKDTGKVFNNVGCDERLNSISADGGRSSGKTKKSSNRKPADDHQYSNNKSEREKLRTRDGGSNGRHTTHVTSYGAAWPQPIKTTG